MQGNRCALIAVLVTALVALGLGSAAPASARVGVTPASWTPTIGSDMTVAKMQQCGNTMYAVGAFTEVNQGGQPYIRNNVFSFNATTGAVSSWDPDVDGPVESIALSKNCAIAYIGGSFKHVGSDSAMNIAAISTSTGRLWSQFAHSADSTVRSVILVDSGTQLLVGGYFSMINGSAWKYYASLNPSTGLRTSYLKASIAGKVANAYSGYTMVWNQQLSRSGGLLLVEGDFTKVGGHTHNQVAELIIRPTYAVVSSWTQKTIDAGVCNVAFYIRSGAFSPDGRTVYLATTGGQGTSPYCDAVTAFQNNSGAKQVWENKTGRDSLYAVVAGKSDVYVGGHERYANNPHGYDNCGAGCVVRQGVGDISATNGMATPWNPGRARGRGADDMLITAQGLWVGSDTYFDSTTCAGQQHGGICFFPGVA